MTQRFNSPPAQLTKAICAVVVGLTQLAGASAQPPDPSATWSPAPAVGTCSRCGNWNWTNADGVACETFTCLGPGWPSCANQTRTDRLCTPGQTFDVTSCAATGVQRCTYTCNADGSGYASPLCQTVGNGGNFRRTLCDYNAGCPVDAGFVEGKPTTIAEQCTQDGVLQTVTRGACGEGGCRRQLVCQPGRPCCRPGIDPGCTPQCVSRGESLDITPQCGPGGAGYQCTFGRLTLGVPLPCPIVMRQPFPRAIVGQPVKLWISDGCSALPADSGRIDVPPPYDECGDTIFAYEGQLGWMCSAPDMADAQWTMNERAWNVGHTNSAGVIAATRNGASITHMYETSSVDLPPNGPGYPNLMSRLPAYQVQLQTRYTLVGAFRYQYRTQETQCFETWGDRKECRDSAYCDAAGHPERANEYRCRPDASTQTVWISPTRELPTFIIPNIAVEGARTPQDPGTANQCGVIPIPVIASQAILKP